MKVAKTEDAFIPEPAYRPFHKLVPWPVVEVIVYDEDGRYVLAYRDDDFTGWHIPGTYIKVNETIQEACDRCVRKDRVAEAVTDVRVIGIHPWLKGQHPFAHCLSLIIACKAVGAVREKPDVRWFSEIPHDVIKEQHPEFLSFFHAWFRSARAHAPIVF